MKQKIKKSNTMYISSYTDITLFSLQIVLLLFESFKIPYFGYENKKL